MNIYAEQYLGRKALTYYNEVQYYYVHKMSSLSKLRFGHRWKMQAREIAEAFSELEKIGNEWILISKLEEIRSRCLEMREKVNEMRRRACLRDFYALLFRKYYWGLATNLKTVILDRKEKLEREKERVIRQISLEYPRKKFGVKKAS